MSVHGTQSPYGILSSDFWDGTTGPAIADAGGAAAQLVALYLTSNRDATMLGLYPLDLLVMRVKIRSLSPKQIVGALQVLQDVAFATYDAVTKFVWVHEMAKFRLNLQSKALDRHDNRVKHIRRLYDGAKPNPFLGPFFDRYAADLHLERRRDYQGASQPLTEDLGRSLYKESLGRGFGTPRKPLTESVTGSRSGSGRSDQDDQDQRADARESHAVLTRIAHDVLTEVEAGTIPENDAKNELKLRAAKAHISYDAEACTKALDSAEHQRARRRA